MTPLTPIQGQGHCSPVLPHISRCPKLQKKKKQSSGSQSPISRRWSRLAGCSTNESSKLKLSKMNELEGQSVFYPSASKVIQDPGKDRNTEPLERALQLWQVINLLIGEKEKTLESRSQPVCCVPEELIGEGHVPSACK